MILLPDAGDPRLEPYRAIRERDLSGRHGLFVAEGEVVLRALLSERSRFRPDSVLLSTRQAERLRPWLSGLPAEVPVFVLPGPALEAVAGFPIHRGILAVGRRGAPMPAAGLLSGLAGPALVLGLVGLANHDNVGGAFRNAAAFGASAVLLDAASCDPLYRKAIRVSVGTCLTVPFARGDGAEALVAALSEAGFTVLALSPGGRETLHEVRWPDRTALLVGSEGEGLPAGVLARLRTVRIGMAPGLDSLNVATASGIALAAAYAARSAAGLRRGD